MPLPSESSSSSPSPFSPASVPASPSCLCDSGLRTKVHFFSTIHDCGSSDLWATPQAAQVADVSHCLGFDHPATGILPRPPHSTPLPGCGAAQRLARPLLQALRAKGAHRSSSSSSTPISSSFTSPVPFPIFAEGLQALPRTAAIPPPAGLVCVDSKYSQWWKN